jgi:hypothetical protein
MITATRAGPIPSQLPSREQVISIRYAHDLLAIAYSAIAFFALFAQCLRHVH